MVDFFNEVEEDLRADRMRSLSRTYLPWAAGVVALAFLAAAGYGGWTYLRDKDTSAASVAYDQGLKAASVTGDVAAADRDFADAVKPMAGGYAVLARIQQAGLAVSQDRIPDAVKILDAAAKSAGDDHILGDLASLKAVYLLLDTASLAELQTRLKPLTEAGRPYRAEAYEAQAMAELKFGRTHDAKEDFGVLKILPDAPDALRRRADMAILAIDAGAGPRLVEVAKAASALPPPSASAPAHGATIFDPSAGSPALPDGAAPQ